jgi:hypothetical protein
VLDFDFFDSGVTRFNAIVLTQPVLLNPRAIPSTGPLDFVLGADTLSLGKFRFFARIQGGLCPILAILQYQVTPSNNLSISNYIQNFILLKIVL